MNEGVDVLCVKYDWRISCAFNIFLTLFLLDVAGVLLASTVPLFNVFEAGPAIDVLDFGVDTDVDDGVR